MRRDMIKPEDLREYLVTRVEKLIEKGWSKGHGFSPDAKIEVDTLERVRREFLHDYTPYDVAVKP